jgi:hypothetical protein
MGRFYDSHGQSTATKRDGEQLPQMISTILAEG